MAAVALPASSSAVSPATSADIATLLAVMEAYQQEQLEASTSNQRELVQRLDRLEARLDGAVAASSSGAASSSPVVAVSSASAPPGPVPPLGSATAIPAVRLARLLVGKAVNELEKDGIEAASAKLRAANGNLQVPWTVQEAAEAYDKAREVRKDCLPPQLEELGKNVLKAVREVLVLLICCGAGKLSEVGFRSALEQAFGRMLDIEHISQMELARSAICRLGRDRVLFERQAPKVFGPTVTPAELNQLFAVYADCDAGNVELEGKDSEARMTSKKRKKPRNRKGTRALAAGSDADVEGPAALGAHALNTPAKLLQRPQKEWEGGDFSPEFFPESMAEAQWLRQCYSGWCPNCRQDTINNWEGMCTLCGGHHQQQFHPAAAARSSTMIITNPFSRGGAVERIDSDGWNPKGPPLVDPLDFTVSNNNAKVEVVERCCLDSLRKTDGSPCLVVMAKEGLPWKQHSGSTLAVMQCSLLCDIIEAAAGAEPSLPLHGGYYARSVHVHQLSDSTPVRFEASMVLMRTLWSTSDSELTELREDSKVRLLNVLRKCRARGHRELVFGAWGNYVNHASLGEISRISTSLKNALQPYLKCFTKITFAVQLDDDDRVQAMREVFSEKIIFQ